MRWLAAALLAGGVAAEDSRWIPAQFRPDPAPVAIAPARALALADEPAFEVLPGGWLGTRDNAVEFHPKAMLSVGWDGNPQASPDPDPGVLLLGIAGADLRFNGGDRWRLDSAGQIDVRRYPGGESEDTLGGSLAVGLLVRQDSWWWRPDASWTRDSEPLAATALAVPRDDWNAALAAGREGRRAGWSFRLARHDTDYLEDAAGFVADDEDVQAMHGDVATWLVAWSRSEIGVRLSADTLRYPHGDARADGSGVRAGLWWRHQPGDRCWLTFEAGAASWRWDAPTAGDPANDDDELLLPAAALRLEWRPEERSRLILALSQDMAPGAVANAARVTALTGTGRLRLGDRTGAFIAGRWERRTDSGAAAPDPTEVRRNTVLRGGVEHEMRDGVIGRLILGWDDSEGVVGVSSTRPTAAIELAAAF